MASELSVWYAKDEQDLDDARLAMLAATNKPATIDFVEIPLSVVQEAGLKVVESLPTVGPEALKSRHRDIADLDLDSLQTVAKIIQRLLSEDKAKRLTAGQCKTMLKQAIANNRFSANELAEGISSKL
ncbi:hypothetical protein B0920_19985 [Massilia sp. KIM]|uniref:hypothetical protein n=1 Tax=Massilia sp. KIM TaxID=1955422 RepID=UPI00098EC2C2|nr:hypothetical protein [Massilia sp. KIM]OON61195.1 hypothetical protein B0920_19985 [Massilia sp. KIM]